MSWQVVDIIAICVSRSLKDGVHTKHQNRSNSNHDYGVCSQCTCHHHDLVHQSHLWCDELYNYVFDSVGSNLNFFDRFFMAFRMNECLLKIQRLALSFKFVRYIRFIRVAEITNWVFDNGTIQILEFSRFFIEHFVQRKEN